MKPFSDKKNQSIIIILDEKMKIMCPAVLLSPEIYSLNIYGELVRRNITVCLDLTVVLV